jgi:hypothetical protein
MFLTPFIILWRNKNVLGFNNDHTLEVYRIPVLKHVVFLQTQSVLEYEFSIRFLTDENQYYTGEKTHLSEELSNSNMIKLKLAILL